MILAFNQKVWTLSYRQCGASRGFSAEEGNDSSSYVCICECVYVCGERE